MSSGNVGVAEEHLDRTEIGAITEQIGGKTVTQGMGRNMLSNASFKAVILNHPLDTTRSEATKRRLC